MNLSSFFHVYLCSNEEKRFLKETETLQFAGHNIANCGKKKIIWPKKPDSNHVSPENFLVLKERIKIENILIVDRLKGVEMFVSIVGHINRSGMSFLRGKTPMKNAEQFPDMSHIYSETEGISSAVVHTLGQERFSKPPKNESCIWSEASGLISGVAHYVGMNVFGVGTGSDVQRKQLIEKILKNI